MVWYSSRPMPSLWVQKPFIVVIYIPQSGTMNLISCDPWGWERGKDAYDLYEIKSDAVKNYLLKIFCSLCNLYCLASKDLKVTNFS